MDSKESLKLFNEKAYKLLNSSFAKDIFSKKSGVNFSSKKGEQLKVTRYGPGLEQIESFVLTFRFFIQDNESSSFKYLNEVYNNINTESKLKEDFFAVREKLNKFLDDIPEINITYNGEQLTRRKIMDIFIYGELSHANKDKRKIYKEWNVTSAFYILENEFIVTIAKIIDVIKYVKNLNGQILKSL